MKCKLDSLGIKRLAVFYVYNDNEHSTRKKYVDIIEKPRDFEQEDIYYYVSIFNIQNNRGAFQFRVDMQHVLNSIKSKTPKGVAQYFAEKAGLSIDRWGCVETVAPSEQGNQ